MGARGFFAGTGFSLTDLAEIPIGDEVKILVVILLVYLIVVFGPRRRR